DVVRFPDGALIVVADGAGGTRGGAAAAEATIKGAREAASGLMAGEIDAAALLGELDHLIRATDGQSTAVIAIVGIGGIFGASVGDSGALHCHRGLVDHLTCRSSVSVPVRFKTTLESSSAAPKQPQIGESAHLTCIFPGPD